MVDPHDIPALVPGDVLHHGELGFAVVDGLDEHLGQVRLDWLEPTAGRPDHIGVGEVGGAYRLCTPWGFLARSVRVPAGLRAFTRSEPLTALRLLLEDVDERLTIEQIHGWLVGRELIEEEEFQAWWQSTKVKVVEHPRFALDGAEVRYHSEGNLERMVQAADGSAALEKAARTFLAQSPAGRFRMFRAGSGDFLEAVLDAAVRKRDIAAILLALRGRQSVPVRHSERLEELALTGDPWLSAALLVRRHGPIERALSAAASDPARRPLLRKTFAALSRSQRVPSVVRLLDRCLAGEGDEEGAAYLVNEMMGGAAVVYHALQQGGMQGQPEESVARAWPRAHRWLREGIADATVERPAAAYSPLLSQLGPLPVDDLWHLSFALASALAERHAQGRHGGVSSARLDGPGQVSLGIPEDGTPRDDVRAAMRLLVEILVGTLPRNHHLSGDDLLAHLTRLAPGISPEWCAVCTRAFAPDPRLRPSNGLDLWEQLARAEAVDRVRRHGPTRPKAQLDVAHDTHIGALKSRLGQINQDAIFFHVEEERSLLVVADGISVSTAGSGNLASAILVQTVVNHWERFQGRVAEATPTEIRAFLNDSLAAANRAICDTSEQLAGGELARHIPMGTTAMIAVTRGAQVWLACLGDSRVYLVTSVGPAQLTFDHNLLGDWMAGWQQGVPTELIGDGHALTGYVGHFDEEGMPEPVPASHFEVVLLPGETLLLTTDGLTDYAASSAAELAGMIEEAAATSDLGSGCRFLVDKANAGGGGDNVTMILARCALG